MEDIKQQIRTLANEYHKDLIAIRRHFHAHPELSKKEKNTADFISTELNKLGIPHQTNVGGFGIVGHIQGQNPEKKLVALRADMDALPIKEANDVSYKSIYPGMMHACGHDVHMASLLGAARILKELEQQWQGSVRLIFQPSEEEYPGGASLMIKEGVLENPRPSAIFGQHVYPEMNAGKVGMKAGKYMASTDEFYITVKGKGGHGALPDQLIDPIVVAAQIVLGLQQIVSRNAFPGTPSVLTIGRLIADGRTNIIPSEVKMEGIIRTFSEEWREEIKQQITKIATGIADSFGAKADVFIDKGYPFLINDETLTKRAFDAVKDLLGEQNVEELEFRMTAEDFAYYSQQVPGCFYRLGTRNDSLGFTSGLHSDRFDADEQSLISGPAVMAWLAINELNQ